MNQALIDNLNGKTDNYLAPFLWLHGESQELLLQEIEKIYDTGIRALCIESRTHNDFCKQGWWNDVKFILEECTRRDMKVWILDDKHFPSGYANGAFEKKYPHLRKWDITERHVDVMGPVEEGAVIAKGWLSAPDEDEILAILACRRVPESDLFTGEVIDITDNQKDGMVYFDLPRGCYRIMFLIRTRCQIRERELYACDKLNPEATDIFLKEVYEPHYAHFKEYFGNTLAGFFSDEPSFGNNQKQKRVTVPGEPFDSFPWQSCVRERLEAKYGKAAFQMLPGLWFTFEDNRSTEIRAEYMNIITDEYRKNFCNRIGQWCREHGVMYIGHVIEDNNTHAMTGAGTGHYFRSLEGQDMSGIDLVFQQLLPGFTEYSISCAASYHHTTHRFYNYVLAKLAASAAHIQKEKAGRAMCEIFGACGWAEDTKIMKWFADHMMVRGINYFVPHAFSPLADDSDCPPTFYCGGKNPQYRFLKYLFQYMNRVVHVLKNGVHNASCILLYDAETRWTGREFLPVEDIAKALYDHQIDYDIVPLDYLDKMKSRKGKVVLNEEQYHVIILAQTAYLDEKYGSQLENLAEEGIEVICVGDDSRDGKAGEDTPVSLKHINIEELVNYFYDNDFWDIRLDAGDPDLRFYHTSSDGEEIYLFFNESIDHEITDTIALSGYHGRECILYDAMNNKAYRKDCIDGKLTLTILPYQSLMVITGSSTFPDMQDTKARNVRELQPQIRISLAEEKEIPEYRLYKTTERLESITSRSGLPGFSGNIKYEFELEITEKDNYILCLGKVGGAAELFVNGQRIGATIVPPFEFEAGKYFQLGTNKIEVVVANHYGYKMRDRFSRYVMFEPAGILGPISLKKKENSVNESGGRSPGEEGQEVIC